MWYHHFDLWTSFMGLVQYYDIAGLAVSQEELQELTNRIHNSSSQYGMEISKEKTKIMTNQYAHISNPIEIDNVALEEVQQFKYLGAIISDEGSKPEILSRIAQANNALSKLKPIWNTQNIKMNTKLKLMKSLVHSIFLYGSETWTITNYLENRIQAFENKCYRKILNITFHDRVSNADMYSRISDTIGQTESLMNTIKKRKLKWVWTSHKK